MDDTTNPRTRQTLDALADLFLTDPFPPSTPPRPQHSTPQPPPDFLESDAAPLRLPPKLRANVNSAVAATLDPARAPVGPFRRWRQGSPARAAAASVPPQSAPLPALRVEAVFLANLPGFGGPWLAQYAQHLAQSLTDTPGQTPDETSAGTSAGTSGGTSAGTSGGVGVLHVDEARIDLELVRPMSQRGLASKPSSADPLDLLAHLAHDAHPPVRRWLVHLPMQLASMPMARDLDDWTILCGSDEAAVVSAYTWLKQMLESDPRKSPRRIGLAIMGSDPVRAAAAGDKLRQAAAGHLHHQVELRAALKQMGPVNLQGLGSFPDTATLWPQVAALLQSMTEEEERETASPFPVSADVSSYAFPSDPVAEPAPEPEPELELPPAQPAATRRAPVAPPQTPAPPPPAAVIDADLDLATFLVDVGGVALAVRCPRQPQTQLLLDQEGRLHLLRRHAHENPPQDPAAGLRAAIVDLLEARAWVREHVQLLALTQRQCRFDLAAEPVLHLFTDQAKLAAGLASRLGPALRLHLLQHVRVGAASTWVSAALS